MNPFTVVKTNEYTGHYAVHVIVDKAPYCFAHSTDVGIVTKRALFCNAHFNAYGTHSTKNQAINMAIIDSQETPNHQL